MPEIECLDQSQSIAEASRIARLSEAVFSEVQPGYVAWRVANMPDVTTFVAIEDNEWLGFKCGYAASERRYYSWLGGVLPGRRSLGLAGLLMEAQHNWLRERGYELVETHVRQANSAMIRTNQKHNFKIVGRFIKTDDVYLIMQSRLAA